MAIMNISSLFHAFEIKQGSFQEQFFLLRTMQFPFMDIKTLPNLPFTDGRFLSRTESLPFENVYLVDNPRWLCPL